jgi:hypothetical protein
MSALGQKRTHAAQHRISANFSPAASFPDPSVITLFSIRNEEASEDGNAHFT